LRGLGNIPGIAGKSPTWLARQMYDIQAGTRRGPGAALMKAAVEKLRNEDYVALVAYISSMEP
jgi:cytochrome c553